MTRGMDRRLRDLEAQAAKHEAGIALEALICAITTRDDGEPWTPEEVALIERGAKVDSKMGRMVALILAGGAR